MGAPGLLGCGLSSAADGWLGAAGLVRLAWCGWLGAAGLVRLVRPSLPCVRAARTWLKMDSIALLGTAGCLASRYLVEDGLECGPHAPDPGGGRADAEHHPHLLGLGWAKGVREQVFSGRTFIGHEREQLRRGCVGDPRGPRSNALTAGQTH